MGESDGGMTEIRFVPDDATSLDSMFAAMSECQQLRPDTDDSDSEAAEEEGMYDDAEEDVGVNGDGEGEERMDAASSVELKCIWITVNPNCVENSIPQFQTTGSYVP